MAVPVKDLLTLDNEVFSAYAFWSGVLVIKMCLMSILTAVQRIKTKTFPNPEDLIIDPKQKVKFDNPDVERVRRAHRNDLENILPFFVIGFLYVLIDPSVFTAVNLFRAVGISRIFHTIVYVVIILPQPSRGIAFFICFGASVYMAIQVIFAAL